jgi:hypothetical protein
MGWSWPSVPFPRRRARELGYELKKIDPPATMTEEGVTVTSDGEIVMVE